MYTKDGDIMRVYFLFDVKDEFINLYKDNERVLFNILRQIYYLQKEEVKYGYNLFSQLTNRIDNVRQENSKLLVEEFVTEVTNTGKLTRTNYEEFVNKLDATGKTYDIEMEIWHIDENPGKKTSQVQYTKIGENGYWIEATTQILPQIGIKVTNNDTVNTTNKEMLLKEGDKIYVKVKYENGNTAGSSLIGYSIAGEYATESSSGMVTVNGTASK